MAEKITNYIGTFRVFADNIKERWASFKETNPADAANQARDSAKSKVNGVTRTVINHINGGDSEDYSHIFREKTRKELIRISAAVMGIEFCYAAETAFVSPTLLKIGVHHAEMTLVWCLSPFIGFFLTPLLGSLSDNCRSQLGRRRPFIILLSIGILLGLILVPNGRALGIAFGDKARSVAELKKFNSTKSFNFNNSTSEFSDPINEKEDTFGTKGNDSDGISISQNEKEIIGENMGVPSEHQWGIFFTIIGTMLLDFDSDACQSPARAYLLDVTTPEDHARGLSTFTIMAGLGGGFGYAMGGINWDVTFVGRIFGGHVRAVFTLTTFLFLGCVLYTLYSFREIPLYLLVKYLHQFENQESVGETIMKNVSVQGGKEYGATAGTDSNGIPFENITADDTVQNESIHSAHDNQMHFAESSFTDKNLENIRDRIQIAEEEIPNDQKDAKVTLRQYLLSIIYMPNSLRILCLTNLFCWMSLVCYSLYFTDFVGEAVFQGNPMAREGSQRRILFEEGVRFGCWGMSLYSLSCSAYSFIIEKLIKRFRAKPVYVCGQLVYSAGMVMMALLQHKVAVIVFSCCAGIMYSTLFTMPYLLLAHYHATGLFTSDFGKIQRQDSTESRSKSTQVRGLGTDVAVVSSMVFLAQFILSLCMGSLIYAVGSTTAVVCAAAFLSFCGAVSATQVVYLDL